LISKSGSRSVDQSDSKQAVTVLGSMANYQCRSVIAKDPTLVQYWQLSCFCYGCLRYDTSHACPQSNHVQEFILHRLSPKAPAQARRLYNGEEDVEASSNGEWIADALCIGDNIVVHAPDGGEPYWLMMVVIPTHTMLETFTDPDGNTYLPGDVVFNGYWYKRLKEGSRTYLLRNDKEPTSVYSHVVLTSKFSLPPIAHAIKSRFAGYEFKAEVSKIIDEALRAAVLLY
jgi:hypothetical protein